jgi:hypothetical protein
MVSIVETTPSRRPAASAKNPSFGSSMFTRSTSTFSSLKYPFSLAMKRGPYPTQIE